MKGNVKEWQILNRVSAHNRAPTYAGEHKHRKMYPCPKQDSKPQLQASSTRRLYIPQTAWCFVADRATTETVVFYHLPEQSTVLSHQEPASTRNLACFPLQFNSHYFIQQSPSANFQLLSRPHTFWKHFWTHNGGLVLKYWKFLFKCCLSFLTEHVDSS